MRLSGTFIVKSQKQEVPYISLGMQICDAGKYMYHLKYSRSHTTFSAGSCKKSQDAILTNFPVLGIAMPDSHVLHPAIGGNQGNARKLVRIVSQIR